MRLSRSESLVLESSKDKILKNSRSKKKHKRLDAICEKVYTRNHNAVEKVELNEGNVGGNENEPRRSTRVRRAPEALDASPMPQKKRRKIDKRGGMSSVDKGKRVIRVKSETLCSTSNDLEDIEENLSVWRSRLRARGKYVRFGGKAKGRRKPFEEFHEFKEETTSGIRESDNDEEFVGGRSSLGKYKRLGEGAASGIQESDKEEEFIGGSSFAAKSKRTPRVKVLSGLVNEDKEIDPPGGIGEEKEVNEELEDEDKEIDSPGGIGEGKKVNEEVAFVSSDEGNGLVLNSGIACVHDDESKDGFGPSQVVEKEETEIPGGSHSEEQPSNDDSEMQLDKQACNSVEHHIGDVENDGTTEDKTEGGEHDSGTIEIDGGKDDPKVGEHLDRPLEAESSEKFHYRKHASDNMQRPIKIKEGRRCGLCGGGTDGKPPKKLVQDGYGSDDEACSGGSASEEPNYDVWDGFGDEPSWLGRLLGPVNDRFGIAGIWVHQQCAVWSPEVYFAGLGCLKNVRAALYRGRVLKCCRCVRPGATIGCRVDRCPKTYHLPCARDSGCIFDHRKFLIACTDHRHIFQPLGSQYLHRLKKMKVKKMQLEIRKVSNDALRKDIEAEEKWLEHCGEDEEFLKRESKRLQRDLLRIAPTYIGGPGCNTEMQYQGWESVAGLQDVIRCMKEVVILPLLYPDLFSNLGLTPPRGVLLHGYPGTGKTLVVRALIGSCARGDRRIAYFARKGADCLGKYVGDAERQLRLLFPVAEKSQPSIIFFDEIDGLAPCRTRQQDQTHSSVVSTLLALMDGLKSRGSVVVIGATNRPDTIDPALRRPGRFDREIYFPLPSVKDREAILSLHTQKWLKKIGGSLLKWVARRTVGFAGADLQALCTQAAIIALRRNFPLQEVLGGAVESALLSKRPPLPSVNVEERDWLDALSLAPPPCSHREAGIAANDVICSPLAAHLVPCLLQPLSKLIVSLYLDERVWLPPALHKAATLIKNVIVSALMEKKLLADKWWFHLQDLLQEADVLSKIEDKLSRTIILTDAFCSFDPVEGVADDRYLSFEPSRVQQVSVHTGLLHSVSYESAIKSGFRILISGEARSGQRHLASCLLHCFSGNIEIQKLDLATLFQEGHGDVIQGLTLILMKCASVGSCILFLPRIDLWAVETCNQFCEDEKASPSSSSSVTEDSSEYQNAVKRVTYLWNSFIEQVESLCVRTPLMILATSEVPFIDLPFGVKQFFRCETLDCGIVNSYKDAVPRFLVEIDGDLSPDLLSDTSVGRLLMDLAQYFIHLLRRGIHANLSLEKNSQDIAELSADAINSSSHPGSTTERENKRVTAPITSATVHNPVKAKSSLLTAISSFGYQILRYPHFAELCWVTSKLRDGPCARINGLWKGWPFNSCIARPLDSKEGIDVTPTSNTAKNMDKSCVARGLIAVGLSAYRGEYTSLGAFLLEIRKVLELLVGCVDTKIQAGKDKYKFFRLLSQVAYFEDMVISWAYTLRSLEVDSPFLEESPQLNFTGCSANPGTCEDSFCDGGKDKISNENLHQSEVLEQIPREANAEHTSDHLLTDADLNVQNRGNEIAAACEEISVPMVLDHCASVVEVHCPLPNGISSETCMPMDVENQSEVGGNLEGSKHSNGFLQRDSLVIIGDGPNVSGDRSGMGPSDPAKICKGDSLVPSASHGIQLDHPVENSSGNSLRIASRSNMSGLLCVYHCCSDCVVNVYQLLLKLLSNEWKLKGSSVTIEDFHDFVASLSVSLQSAVRKLFVKVSPSNACDEKLMEQKCRKYTQCTQMCVSQRKNWQNVVMPKECSCHSAGEGVSVAGNFLRNSQFGFDIKFFFRDGVLVAISDSDFTDPCHCKFEKLCLCSLVECIAMSKDF